MTIENLGKSGKRMLAVVRCGDKSLHETWTGVERNFDFAVSYFGDNPEKSFFGARYVDIRKGGKWDGIYGFFQAFPEAISEYDYFWFPDDDISAKSSEINRLISIGNKYDLHLFQPALDDKSYYSHLITLKHQSFTLRYSNFVEIMAPVLSRNLLERVLPTIEITRSGFGLDFIWPQIASQLEGHSKLRSAIVDSVTVRHTRPVGGSLHTFIKSLPGARSSKDELIASLDRVDGFRHAKINGVPVPRIRVVGSISRSGRLLNKFEIFVFIIRDLLLFHKNSVQPISIVSVIRHATKTFF